ncbi:Target of rapamycin complex 2 subunit bit61 [Schizosaccharomyces pombe]|uniref:Target of rapamycin complex 2 subunit bit61 n=1 Tax=Schizosaccharomyces pombe (strain 972 / ATCC 24843) TaxID=284812 RepID=BIT61_SCHPO|nr:TORC2 subunit Bit61 [Schizosaccharomyces pombe]O74547.1 RecName: Full=Target of rapamycin complex 2 subunit bit61; Short=TORC2 subunit bit61 [Schizosaccharomyces pombe 972h-]CAA20712.1 TORC2 subunit Bit61 [Schizosaccharomyces pombe]|eukprot:NP_588254.1 TORC2 subunit Bit61 [Schizosaccharomyces pombe]
MVGRGSFSSTSSASSINWIPKNTKTSIESVSNTISLSENGQNQDLETVTTKESNVGDSDTTENIKSPFNGQWPFSRRSSQSSSHPVFEETHWSKHSKRPGKLNVLTPTSPSNVNAEVQSISTKTQLSLLNLSPHKHKKPKDGLDLSALQKTLNGSRNFLRGRRDAGGIFGASIPQSLVTNQIINGFGAASLAFAKLGKVRSPLEGRFNLVPISADETWLIVESEVCSLYSGEALHYSLEDLNGILILHLQALIRDTKMNEFVGHLETLFRKATKCLSDSLSPVPEELFLNRIIETWLFFFSSVLPYVQGVFLPIKTKLFDEQEKTQLPYEVNEFCSTNREKLNVHRLALMTFRDYMVLPIANRIQICIGRAESAENALDNAGEVFARLFQILSLLASVRTNDSKEQEITNLATKVRCLLIAS